MKALLNSPSKSVALCQRFKRRIRQCGAFELRISTRVARLNPSNADEPCWPHQAIGQRLPKKLPYGSRAKCTRAFQKRKFGLDSAFHCPKEQNVRQMLEQRDDTLGRRIPTKKLLLKVSGKFSGHSRSLPGEKWRRNRFEKFTGIMLIGLRASQCIFCIDEIIVQSQPATQKTR